MGKEACGNGAISISAVGRESLSVSAWRVRLTPLLPYRAPPTNPQYTHTHTPTDCPRAPPFATSAAPCRCRRCRRPRGATPNFWCLRPPPVALPASSRAAGRKSGVVVLAVVGLRSCSSLQGGQLLNRG